MRSNKKRKKIKKIRTFFRKGSILIPVLFVVLIIGGALFAGSFFPHQSTAQPESNNNMIVDPSNKDPFKNLQLRNGRIVTPTPTPTPTPQPTLPPTPTSTPGPPTSTPIPTTPTPTSPPTTPRPTSTPAPTNTPTPTKPQPTPTLTIN